MGPIWISLVPLGILPIALELLRSSTFIHILSFFLKSTLTGNGLSTRERAGVPIILHHVSLVISGIETTTRQQDP
ncbi:hypothetical protein TNIN_151161 [Trichonephila inaurata madagascariensis]|uniref:Uncharacterized protein n=1 Tax=Trichonephila inaurata madagascariensis TaxID=2747483 RepID=A0A8X6IXJ3_9ARAC|nr:hypothetical protein TNIN_151161 [Trichonephila inaurata madagascariensis]